MFGQPAHNPDPRRGNWHGFDQYPVEAISGPIVEIPSGRSATLAAIAPARTIVARSTVNALHVGTPIVEITPNRQASRQRVYSRSAWRKPLRNRR